MARTAQVRSVGRLLALIAASLAALPVAIHVQSVAALLKSGASVDLALFFVLPLSLALALAAAARTRAATAVLVLTLAFASLALLQAARSNPLFGDDPGANARDLIFAILAVAAGVASYVLLRRDSRLVPPPELGQDAELPRPSNRLLAAGLGLLGGALFLWLTLADPALRDVSRLGSNEGGVIIFAIPAGIAIAVMVAAIWGSNWVLLASLVCFVALWFVDASAYVGVNGETRSSYIPSTLALVIGTGLGIASLLLSRHARRVTRLDARRAPINLVALLTAAFATLPFVGVFLGHIALSQIRRYGEVGRTLVVLALLVAYGSTIWALVVLTILVAYPPME
jgi:hypothetical protein